LNSPSRLSDQDKGSSLMVEPVDRRMGKATTTTTIMSKPLQLY
jgi:hypothetical protein